MKNIETVDSDTNLLATLLQLANVTLLPQQVDLTLSPHSKDAGKTVHIYERYSWGLNLAILLAIVSELNYNSRLLLDNTANDLHDILQENNEIAVDEIAQTTTDTVINAFENDFYGVIESYLQLAKKLYPKVVLTSPKKFTDLTAKQIENIIKEIKILIWNRFPITPQLIKSNENALNSASLIMQTKILVQDLGISKKTVFADLEKYDHLENLSSLKLIARPAFLITNLGMSFIYRLISVY